MSQASDSCFELRKLNCILILKKAHEIGQVAQSLASDRAKKFF